MSSAGGVRADHPELGREQEYVSKLYRRLDELRAQSSERLDTALRATGGTPQARSERETAITMYTDQLAHLSAVENGLCFGRLDFDSDERRYIGRIGIFDDDGDYEPLLIDWRAPAARPFYLATAASPEGVTRRRHIRSRNRTVVGLDDEVLDLNAARPGAHEEVTGEAALLAALDARRTGRMKDIVETIQAEQDRVIRSEPGGVLVVQGGPGTGKTAVALHRVAYLLYTYRQQLSTRVVLVVGPNETFLRYISQVLPSLAETGVLLCTLGDLYPGITARRLEPPEVAEIKGREVMTEVLAAAIRDQQRVPDKCFDLAIDGDVLRLDRAVCEDARAVARRSGKLHNLARPIFDTEIIHALSLQLADRIGSDPYADDPLGGDDAPGDPQILAEADLAEIRRELREEPEIQAALDWMWPILTPRQLLRGLYASDDRLATAAPQLTEAERALLRREPGGGWSPADVPLLDEAAELLGEDNRPVDALAEKRRRARIAYAEGALEIMSGSASLDFEDEAESEILAATDLIEAERLADRHAEEARLTPAERAAADRKWAFGHIVVDEAQELSPMAWRLLMRRCPSRSMTVVGDVAQTGELAGTTSWQRALEPYVDHRWRLAELSVNYRTPAEIMAVGAEVLAGIDPSLRPPRSVRHSGVEPWRLRVEPTRLDECLVDVVSREVAEVADGRIGVIVPAGREYELGRSVTKALPEAAVGDQPDLERRVVVLTVRQAKGLEFDSVIVVEPGLIAAESRRGRSDLYVALTRATQRLGVLHTRPLPAALEGLRPLAAGEPSRAG
ncbi:AAA family ATPase [Planosporangium thailandense]|uniref:AAA family ATPase n=1 Tax=Planosporangium thailandense TaxID=765197 RepID=A0ABX0Y208_9ACTN|nr:UvrD-helicase domain-containing protein [Planosporangium thailandense]NJC72375.1 AAA family ATPase [Planosporangium thailandense]